MTSTAPLLKLIQQHIAIGRLLIEDSQYEEMYPSTLWIVMLAMVLATTASAHI
jgi:hypothetical protein